MAKVLLVPGARDQGVLQLIKAYLGVLLGMSPPNSLIPAEMP